MRNWKSKPSRPLGCRVVGVGLMTILLWGGWPAQGQTPEAASSVMPSLRAQELLDLARYLASTPGAPDAYARVIKAAFNSPADQPINVTAYEENRSFVYAVAEMQAHLPAGGTAQRPEDVCRWVRRLIVLNSSMFLVEDELRTPRPSGMEIERMLSTPTPTVAGSTAHLRDPSGEIFAEILYPRKAAYRMGRTTEGAKLEGNVLEATTGENQSGARFMQVFRAGSGGARSGVLQPEITTEDGAWKFTATIGGKIFKLTLPPPTEGAGEVAIASLDGKVLVGTRPFPSGILPHGPEGNRLLELWDSDYRKVEPAYWDIGRPADELQKFVSGGTVSRCRVVDMCCGSGTDAIYLASKGFDVTAIDVAPTALGQALAKAAAAKVSVHWLVASILAPPEVKPFDFVYDRGCYHVVRDQNLPAYIETLRRFSRPGTKFLLLATRHDELVEGGQSGVTEEELRFDFLALFNLQWLREIRLESNQPGPPGWSAFLIRNSAP